ncbi:MAG TPA: hypothetical protein VIT22_10610 [Pseudoxanthomonas sp.]
MPDRRIPRGEPHNWSEAFAALPLASPERDVWPQLARELRPAKRNRRALWWSMAAALALLAALPLAWHERGGAPDAPSMASVPRPTAAPEFETQPVVSASDTGMEPALANEAAATATSRIPSLESGPARDTATPRKRARSKRHVQPVAKVDDPATASDTSDHLALQSLYAQSAQLEGLLAQMQDERMASGPAAALAGQFETRLALIDASLSQPSLEAEQCADLWRDRVDALQQLVGFESTQRWLTAQGERYDGQLVAVY